MKLGTKNQDDTYSEYGLDRFLDNKNKPIIHRGSHYEGASVDYLNDALAFETFNRERIPKQSLCVKQLIVGDIEDAEKTLIELIDSAINNQYPECLNKLLTSSLIDIFLFVIYSLYSKIKGIYAKDLLSINDINNIYTCSDMNEVKTHFLEIMTRLKVLENNIKNESTLGKIFHYVNSNYTNPQITLNSIAEKFHMNYASLSKMYKKEFGTNIMESIHLMRITEAKILLDNSELSISEIAEKVGYYDYRTFSKFFKRMQGVTPSEYRGSNPRL